MTKKILELTDEEVLVLANYLSRRTDEALLEKSHYRYDMNDPDFAERVVLSNLNNQLESLDSAAFAQDYIETLEKAKTAVTENHDPKSYGL